MTPGQNSPQKILEDTPMVVIIKLIIKSHSHTLKFVGLAKNKAGAITIMNKECELPSFKASAYKFIRMGNVKDGVFKKIREVGGLGTIENIMGAINEVFDESL